MGLVVVAPLVPRFAARLGARQVVGLGFAITTAGFAVIGLTDAEWMYRAFVIPLIAIAVGMGMSNGPASSASTSCVPVEQVGSASGVSNMARYVGAAVATALAATVYSSFTASGEADGLPTSEALTNGLQATAWLMAVFSLAGVAMAVVMGRHARSSTGTLEDCRGCCLRPHAHAPHVGDTHVVGACRGSDVTPDRKVPMHPNPRSASHCRRRPGALAVTGIALALALALAGCSGDTEDASLKKAQATVTAKEKDLTEAEAAAKAAETGFCTASTTYVTAIDRYGDVLNATAPTVGDVKDAGSDLAQPGEDAQKAAQAVADTRSAVATAEQELADAQTALAAAQASASGTTPSEAPSSKSPSPSPTPEASPGCRRRRPSSRPLRRASRTRPRWPRRPSSSTPPRWPWRWRGSSSSGTAGASPTPSRTRPRRRWSSYTKTLQQALADAGYYDAKVDGVYGPKTVAAVEALQKAKGLPQTGTLDKATEKALRAELAAKGGAAAQEETASTAAVQQSLKLAGYWDGPVDGVWTDELTTALEKLQKDLGVKVTGTVDAATIAAVEKAIAELGAAPSPSPSVTASPQPTTTG